MIGVSSLSDCLRRQQDAEIREYGQKARREAVHLPATPSDRALEPAKFFASLFARRCSQASLEGLKSGNQSSRGISSTERPKICTLLQGHRSMTMQ